MTKRSTKRTPGGAAARSGAMSIRGVPTIHSSASSIPRQASTQHVDALVRAQQAEAQHDGAVVVAAARAAAAASPAGREDAVRDHVDALARHAELVDQPRAPVLGVHDDRVDALVERALGVALARRRLAREHVVGGEHERAAVGAQQVPSSGCTGSHWKCTTSASRPRR